MQAVPPENKSLGSTAFVCSDIFKTTQAPQYCGICVFSRQKKKSGYSIKIVTLICEIKYILIETCYGGAFTLRGVQC